MTDELRVPLMLFEEYGFADDGRPSMLLGLRGYQGPEQVIAAQRVELHVRCLRADLSLLAHRAALDLQGRLLRDGASEVEVKLSWRIGP